MGDEREPDQSNKLKQAIDILSSICSGSTSGTTSGDTSGGSSASRSSSQRHPDRSRARGTGNLLFNMVQFVWSRCKLQHYYLASCPGRVGEDGLVSTACACVAVTMFPSQDQTNLS